MSETPQAPTPFDHPNVELTQNGAYRIRLEYPYEHDGQNIAGVVLVRPKAKHMQAISKVDPEDDAGGQIVTVAQLSGLSPETVAEMDLVDLVRCAQIGGEMLGKSIAAGLSA